MDRVTIKDEKTIEDEEKKREKEFKKFAEKRKQESNRLLQNAVTEDLQEKQGGFFNIMT
jgi:microfibrillar-associated protein 1